MNDMSKYQKLPLVTADGSMWKNTLGDYVEALIPTVYPSNHAASILELPNGDLLSVWFAGSKEGNSDVKIVLSRLEKDAERWSQPCQITNGKNKSEQNPSLFLTPDNVLWLIYTSQDAKELHPGSKTSLQYTAEIKQKVSYDNGYTWSDEETLVADKGSFCRQSIQILSNGRWIFANWKCFNDDSHNGSNISLVRISDNQGTSWRNVDISGSVGRVHPYIVELQPGHLIAIFRSRFADHIYMSHSYDFGDSWGSLVKTELPNNNSGITAIRLKSGRLALIYNDIKVNDDTSKTVWPYERCPIVVAISEDEGKTWPFKRLLEAGEGFLGTQNLRANLRYEYPCFYQGLDGSIHAVYSYQSRKCIKYMRITEEWIMGLEKIHEWKK